jgi:phosphotransacetylase
MYAAIVAKETFKKMLNISKIGTGRKLGSSVSDTTAIFIDTAIAPRPTKSEIIKLSPKLALGSFDT